MYLHNISLCSSEQEVMQIRIRNDRNISRIISYYGQHQHQHQHEHTLQVAK